MEAKAREALERFEQAQHHGGGGHGDHDDASTSHLVRNAAITVAVLAAFLAVATLLATKAMTKVNSALDRLKNYAKKGEEEPEGDPEGVEEGTVTDARLALMGNKYATEIYKCMKKNFKVEGVSQATVRGKKVLLVVRVQPNGKLFQPPNRLFTL